MNLILLQSPYKLQQLTWASCLCRHLYCREL